MYPTIDKLMRPWVKYNDYTLREQIKQMVNENKAILVECYWGANTEEYKNKHPDIYKAPKFDGKISWSSITGHFLTITRIQVQFVIYNNSVYHNPIEVQATFVFDISDSEWLNAHYQQWIESYVINEELKIEAERRAVILANLLYDMSQELMVPVNPNFKPIDHIESI